MCAGRCVLQWLFPCFLDIWSVNAARNHTFLCETRQTKTTAFLPPRTSATELNSGRIFGPKHSNLFLIISISALFWPIPEGCQGGSAQQHRKAEWGSLENLDRAELESSGSGVRVWVTAFGKGALLTPGWEVVSLKKAICLKLRLRFPWTCDSGAQTMLSLGPFNLPAVAILPLRRLRLGSWVLSWVQTAVLKTTVPSILGISRQSCAMNYLSATKNTTLPGEAVFIDQKQQNERKSKFLSQLSESRCRTLALFWVRITWRSLGFGRNIRNVPFELYILNFYTGVSRSIKTWMCNPNSKLVRSPMEITWRFYACLIQNSLNSKEVFLSLLFRIRREIPVQSSWFWLKSPAESVVF